MTYTQVTERGFTGEETMFYLLSLPQKRQAYNGKWKATQVTPCPLLIKCAACLRYLPPFSFYVLKSGRNGRVDAMGVKRSARCVQCHQNDYTKLDARQKLYYAARQRANLKGHEFTITLDDIVVPECCPVFGFKLEATVGKGRLPLSMLERSPSLDRIDNSKGYVPGNVCVISLRANNVKKDATLDELRAILYHMENPMDYPVVDYSRELMKRSEEIADKFLQARMASPAPKSNGVPTLLCTLCKRTLAIDHFYELSNKKAGRLDADGNTRACRCRECSLDDYLKSDHRSKLLNAARRRSREFNREFSLVKGDIVIPEFCPVLGIKLLPSVGEGRKNLNEVESSPSLDRIDSSKGYTKDNVQVISFRANNLKKDATLGEIKALVNYVENFTGELTK